MGWALSWQPIAFQTNAPDPAKERAWAGAALGGRVTGWVSRPRSLPGLPAQHPEPSPPEPEPQAPEGSQAETEGPPSPEASRSPARGAYLQSLEPSSRRWLLGGAKPPEEATLGPGAPGSGEPAGEIWYNPIPEEDPRPLALQSPGPQPGSAESEGPASEGEHSLIYPPTHSHPSSPRGPGLSPIPSPSF